MTIQVSLDTVPLTDAMLLAKSATDSFNSAKEACVSPTIRFGWSEQRKTI
ncbi:MAG: hypothetical protein ABFD54_17555 [Armatimonadota bacterium]|nr:hypothetical protein [bacterium]